MRKVAFLFLAVCAVAVTAGCGSDAAPVTPDPSKVTAPPPKTAGGPTAGANGVQNMKMNPGANLEPGQKAK